MANRLRLQLPQTRHDTPWEPEKALAEALAEKAEFLNQNPKYLKFQREIDGLLDKAGTPENRMTVLAVLMESKLLEMHQQLRKLNRILIEAGAKPPLKRVIEAKALLIQMSKN